jgi:hypothetical protein
MLLLLHGILMRVIWQFADQELAFTEIMAIPRQEVRIA